MHDVNPTNFKKSLQIYYFENVKLVRIKYDLRRLEIETIKNQTI